ncbi:MAG: vWA domain-containing protein [Candidatus Binatia bacterium]
MFLKTFFDALRYHVGLRRRLEGLTVSALFHLLLILLLATITISAGGEGFGLVPGSRSTKVQISLAAESVEQTSLENLIENVEVKPLEVPQLRRRDVRLPELSSFAAPRPSSKRLTNLKSRYSPTTVTGSLSAQFGSFIGGLRKSGLDIAVVIDATASMQHVIDDIKANALGLVERIQHLVPIARVGVVAFRDRGEDFVVRWSDLSFHASKIRAFINDLEADGGGDWEEGVRQGIEAAMDELSWRRRSKRVIIVVGSSPPHRKDMEAIEALAAEFRDTGGVMSTIDLTRRMHEEYETRLHTWLYGKPPEKISPLPPFYQDVRRAFRAIADEGGGEMAALGTDAELTEQILFFAFGSRWQKEVSRYTVRH